MAKFIHLIEMVLTLLMLSRRSHSDMPCARKINAGSKDIITESRENGLYVYILFNDTPFSSHSTSVAKWVKRWQA